ncbi:UNVERIFIED_CONTAM: protein, chloroplastic [Sesamum latifolium]|uniref:Protein TIC 40, chloroplastic n=1 Tax=Sesamum latifolium TaxID=2727402 RepID=A0AAW2W8G6_9LAMI
MENLALVSSTKIVLGFSPNPRNSVVSGKSFVGLPFLLKKTGKNGRNSKSTSSVSVLSLFQAPKVTKSIVPERVARDCFASIASSSSQETSSVGANPQLPVTPPPSQVGSPLFWIGVGVGLSALFSWVAGRVKKYAMEQALKTFTQQMNAQNNPFGNAAFSPGSPFPFPPAAAPASDTSRVSTPVTAQAATVDVPATNVEDPPSIPVKENVEPEKEPKKYVLTQLSQLIFKVISNAEYLKQYFFFAAFVDVSPEETFQNTAFESYKEQIQMDSPNDPQSSQPVSQNGTASKPGIGASERTSTSTANPLLSVEALEKMMEDPTVQKMVYPYLPEEMRNPATFKWMLQNPQYRQQLQDMLNNMGGSPEWDSRMMDSLKNFDLSSPEVKQQFDQIGLTPEEVISKIMANPDIAMAFQNPRVQAAIMECSQNPLSIAKYQNDKEVMDVFNKISELFPGATDDEPHTTPVSMFLHFPDVQCMKTRRASLPASSMCRQIQYQLSQQPLEKLTVDLTFQH